MCVIFLITKIGGGGGEAVEKELLHCISVYMWKWYTQEKVSNQKI